MHARPSPFAPPESERRWLEVAATIAAECRATAESDDASGELPLQHLRALSASGLDAAFLPREHGGEALSYAALAHTVRLLASAHPAVAAVWLMHLGAAHALVMQSSPEEASFFAAELRRGARFANALSEAAGGNHFLNSHQDAPSVDGGWSLTGRKLFVSGAEAAEHFLVNVRIDGGPAFFGVTRDETVSLPPLDATMGMRATRSRAVAFEGTLLSASRRCGPPPADYANLITIGFPALSIGIAEAALDALVAGAQRVRTPGAAPLAEAPWVRSETGAVAAELRAGRLLAENTAWLADQRDPSARDAATEAKMLANELAKKAAALALSVGGGGAYLARSPVQRIFRDAQAGALMAYSVPFSREAVGAALLDT
ncbi:acyl-CoA dehydrogenase family protein [Rathayibacter sp. AY1A3]|uniref:acyl-CoA dehydrogenase family protein n=1 Tax=Rathayibacter sp. AY1A3 TaxID=2080521 RepID=UPI000CE723A9|nr:acyl-CoA dehydrogenase family protein [Rathayibacter sp. AY1A3]PPF29430.1 acyl-CoA dehydrogenase [Rathayibacter sp. AY1A3]